MEEQQKYEVATRKDFENSLTLQKVADGLFKSGLFPNAKNAFGAFAITQYGYELGVGPMMSLKNINIISGQLAANGQLMLSLAMAKGVTFQVKSESDKEVTIIFSRQGFGNYTSTFTMADAAQAGLTGKDNWKKYPKDMLYWRCVAKGLRRIAPDAVMGLYTPDEITNGDITTVEQAEIIPPTPTIPHDDKVDSGPSDALQTVSESQIKRLFTIANKSDKSKSEIKGWLEDHGMMSSKELTSERYDELVKWIETPKVTTTRELTEELDCPIDGEPRTIGWCRDSCPGNSDCTQWR